MPEEQAFCVLVKIMFDYGMRDVYKQGFEELHLRFYQLERLMQVRSPSVILCQLSVVYSITNCYRICLFLTLYACFLQVVRRVAPVIATSVLAGVADSILI